MRYFFLLALVGIIACETEEIRNGVTFSGQVIDADSPEKTFLQGIKIDLQVPISFSEDSILNSTLTDSNGKYLFTIKDLDESFEFYKVEISDEYHKRCFELLKPDMTISGHKIIKRNAQNVWDLNSCVTGKVETSILKKSATKDTIRIVVSTQYPRGTYFTDLNAVSVTDNKHWTNFYYYNGVRSVKYIIDLKKENGDIVSWTEEKELKPKETIKFDIEF